MRQSIAICLFLIISAPSVQSQELQSLAPEVDTVITAGYWANSDGDEGHYRVVIATGGFEHVVSEIWVEWIAFPKDRDQPARVLKSSHIDQFGTAQFSDPSLTQVDGRWILTFLATHIHCKPYAVRRLRIALGLPGQITVLGSDELKRGCD